MAGAADKKQAQRNLQTLASVHKLSAVINTLAILFVFILKRPSSGKKWFIIWSLPLLFCQYTVEKIGRPVYSLNQDGYQVLVKPGDDLQQSGLTEYMFDIIYLTLLIDILMCIFGTMKVWWLLLIVPLFAGYKLKWIAGMLFNFLKSKRLNNHSSSPNEDPQMSKRQQKLAKRAEKMKHSTR